MSIQSNLQPDLYLSPHLNEDQFAECALGEELAPELAAHLASCEACRTEVVAFAQSVDSFNATSLAWSEQQPVESLRPRVRRDQKEAVRTGWAVASWALAGCVAVVSGVSVANHWKVNHAPVSTVAAVPTEDSAAQIARDNKLLLAVAQATKAKTVSPLEEYGIVQEPVVSSPGRKAQDQND